MKKRKITINLKVVSVAFLILSVMMLTTVSYAYFTARVEGNENAQAIDVSAAKMGLKYNGENIVSLEGALPGAKHTIEFSVTNTGTVATKYNVDIIDVVNDFVQKEELVYSIKRDNEEIKEETIAPVNNTTLLEKESIEVGGTNNYELTIHFKETGDNQNSNQGKTFSGLIQVGGYEEEKEILGVKYHVIQHKADFNTGFPNANTNEKEIETGSGLYKIEDDEGTSYVFRGKVENNYVKFGKNSETQEDLIWRIIRINGDGTIRLVLDANIGNHNYNAYNGLTGTAREQLSGYTKENTTPCTKEKPCTSNYIDGSFQKSEGMGTDSGIKKYLEDWYKANLAEYDDKIVLGTFCNDTSYGSGEDSDTRTGNLYYGPYARLSNSNPQPQLTCPDPIYNPDAQEENRNYTTSGEDGTKLRTYGGVYKLKIGLLSADEMVIAGLRAVGTTGTSPNDSSWLKRSYTSLSMSPRLSNTSNTTVYNANAAGYVTNYYVPIARGVEPVINLKADVLTANVGNGTKESPFEISL